MAIADHIAAVLESQSDSIPRLLDAIQAASVCGDSGARELFEQILGATEDHVDALEARLHTIREIGVEAYLREAANP